MADNANLQQVPENYRPAVQAAAEQTGLDLNMLIQKFIALGPMILQILQILGLLKVPTPIPAPMNAAANPAGFRTRMKEANIRHDDQVRIMQLAKDTGFPEDKLIDCFNAHGASALDFIQEANVKCPPSGDEPAVQPASA
jgi:hypothetical protein